MSMKKIFALLLTVAMLVATFASCAAPAAPTQTDNNRLDLAQTPSPAASSNTSTALSTKTVTNVNIMAGSSAIENFAVAELK